MFGIVNSRDFYEKLSPASGGSHTNSMLRWHSRSRRRLDCTRLRYLRRKSSTASRRQQSRALPDQAHRQKHRPPGPDYAHPNSRLTAQETTCSDRGHRQQQSAPSNPPTKSQRNHIIDGVFTQPRPDAAPNVADTPLPTLMLFVSALVESTPNAPSPVNATIPAPS